ncbi:MAG: transporter substrate-binding domain-containing protein [Clostridiales bacterium]|nr:transporter substrate-binding domain-containing protein [Clostridiales bacterium]
MKKRFLFTTLILTLIAGVLSGCGTSDESSNNDTTVVKVGTMGTYSPFSYEGEDGKLTGYDLEVLRKVEEVDPSLKFEFIAGPWDSLFVGLDSDKFQMLANQITSNDERKQKYYLTDNSYFNCVSQIIVKKGTTGINSLEDLKGKKIGLTVGDSFTLLVEKWNKEHDNILTINYYEQDITTILQDIVSGRIDATVNDPIMAESKAKTQGLDIEAVGERLSSDPTYFIFKQDDEGKKLKEKIDAALSKLKENGELSKLSNEWFGVDYTK